MSKPDWCSTDVWDEAGDRADELHEVGDYMHLESRKVIARAILAAKAEERENIAAYVEGKGGVIPGAAVFAWLVSRNNQPCMSGDPRDRLHSHVRRNFDDATASLAAAIRKRGEA